MVAVLIGCPKCRASYRVQSDNIGRKARCTKCDHVFLIESNTDPSAPTHEEPLLIPCPYCGFQDFGNFCSECGGRLREVVTIDFDGCKIPTQVFSHCPTEFEYDCDPSSGVRRGDHELYTFREACESYNKQIDEMSRAWRFGGGSDQQWLFDRVHVAEILSEVPSQLPRRTQIEDAVWAMVGHVEREILRIEFDKKADQIEAFIAAGDPKRAGRAMEKLHIFAQDRPAVDSGGRLQRLTDALRQLQEA